MKKIFVAMMAVAALVGCTNKSYTISGVLEPEKEYQLFAAEEGGWEVEKATFTTDAEGKFSLNGEVDLPYFAAIIGSDSISSTQVRLFVEPGKICVEPSSESPEYEVTGTPSNDALILFNRESNLIMQALFMAESEEEAEAAFAQRDSLSRAMVAANKNLFGALLLSEVFYMWEDDEVKAFIEEFPAELKQTPYLAEILKLYERKANTEIGKPYMELTLNDKEGNPVALSSLVGEGKWVLVDFWATWCEPCKAEIPALKEAYAAFHDKGFEIYGVSLDRDPEAWAAYITEHEMNWVNTLGRDGNPASAEMIDQYAVQSIPSNFLIGPDGTIVARHLRGEAVMQTLQEQIQ